MLVLVFSLDWEGGIFFNPAPPRPRGVGKWGRSLVGGQIMITADVLDEIGQSTIDFLDILDGGAGCF